MFSFKKLYVKEQRKCKYQLNHATKNILYYFYTHLTAEKANIAIVTHPAFIDRWHLIFTCRQPIKFVVVGEMFLPSNNSALDNVMTFFFETSVIIQLVRRSNLLQIFLADFW